MAINKVLEFAKNGLKSLSGLNPDLGFPREEKPAREWFNYLFNLIFSILNELIDEVNKLRTELDALKLRVNTTPGVPPVVVNPDVPTPPPYVPSGLLTLTTNQPNNVITGTALVTLEVGADIPNGRSITFKQEISYGYKSGVACSAKKKRTVSGTVMNGFATCSFPIDPSDPLMDDICAWLYTATDNTTYREISKSVYRAY